MQIFLVMKMMRMAHQLGLWNPLSYLPHSMFFSLSQILTRQSSQFLSFHACNIAFDMNDTSERIESFHDKAKVDGCSVWSFLLCGWVCHVFYTHSHLICNQYPNFFDWMGPQPPSDERLGIISKINYSYIRSVHTVAICKLLAQAKVQCIIHLT